MKKTTLKRIALALAAAIMLMIILAIVGAPAGSAGAAAIASPLPCPVDITPPGAICVIEVKPTGVPAGFDQKRASWRIAFPFVAR